MAARMGAEILRSRHLLEDARLARLNTRRLIIQARYLADKARELHRLARFTCSSVQRSR